jgi:uncharacterized protein Yka (UPF0111/DUF47 family)
MSLVGHLLSREDRFAGLLESSALEVQAGVKALDQLLNSASPAVTLKSFVQSRAKEQEIKGQIDALLCQRASSQLDHSDIEALALALNRIAKGTRRFAERYLLCAVAVPTGSFARQLKMLDEASVVLHQMVTELNSGLKVAAAKKQNDLLQKIEGEADKLFTTAVVELYQGRHDPMQAIMLRDLYEVLDRIFDRFRNTGNLILQIVLKLS